LAAQVSDRRIWLAAALIAIAAIAGVGGARAQELVFDLRIENGRVAPNMRLIRLKQGDRVRLRITSDRPVNLHLHGYDIEARVEPGKAAEMSFAARAAGRFPLEEHRANARGHSHGEAPLVRIEVRPR
jgi:hypothetical protein